MALELIEIACLCLQSDEVKGVHHRAWLKLIYLSYTPGNLHSGP